MNNPKVLALISILIWSLGPVFARFISFKTQYLLTGLAYIFAFIVLFIYSYLQNKEVFLQKLKKIELRYLLIGLFGYSIYSLSFIQAFRAYNSATEPTILNYTWPVFAILLTEIFFRIKKQKDFSIYFIEGTGVLLGFFAIVLLVTQGNISSFQINNMQGLAWGLLTGSSYGLFSAYSSTVPKAKQSIFLLAAIFSGLIVTLLLSLSELSVLSSLTFKDFMVAAFLGVFVNGVAYITWTRASRLLRDKNINISSVASMMFFLPVISLINIAIVFKEKTLFHPNTVIVLALLILSSILCQKADAIRKHFSKE